MNILHWRFAALFLCALGLSAARLFARETTLPYSREHIVQPLALVPQFAAPTTDVARELASDPKPDKASPLRVATPPHLGLECQPQEPNLPRLAL